MNRDIILYADEIPEGGRLRVLCPTCGGGSSGEVSLNLAVTDGVLLWKCHRASCTERGGYGSGVSFVRTKPAPDQAESKTNPYEGAIEYLTPEWIEYLRDTIGWQEEHLEIGRPRLAVDENRVAYPIFSPLGARRGYVLRSYDRSVRTKTRTHMDVEEPHLSWYRPNDSATVVVVEDIPSAVRASLYTDAVALCGAECNTEYAAEIAAHYNHVVWALDADATAQAIRLKRDHALLYDTSHVLVLEKDLKNQTEEEISWTLSSLCTSGT
jgi:hypothetical protein